MYIFHCNILECVGSIILSVGIIIWIMVMMIVTFTPIGSQSGEYCDNITIVCNNNIIDNNNRNMEFGLILGLVPIFICLLGALILYLGKKESIKYRDKIDM